MYGLRRDCGKSWDPLASEPMGCCTGGGGTTDERARDGGDGGAPTDDGTLDSGGLAPGHALRSFFPFAFALLFACATSLRCPVLCVDMHKGK